MTSTLLWWLIAVQIAMGAFDTLFHHELTERLAWRPSQAAELRLHAVRNALYALLFLVLGFAEPRGWLASLTLTVLLAEVGITLADFVEEDLSRRLPATERINHTLLALNYGGILALMVPILLAWAGEPTALPLTTHGAWSGLALSAALGVALFGARDWFAAARSDRLAEPPAAGLVALPPGCRVLVTGGTGLIGRRLVAALAASGHAVTVLTRDAARAAALPAPHAVVTRLDQIPDDARFDAVVNLAGEPVADGPWTRARRRRILASRLRTTRDLRRLIARLRDRPAVVVSGSAVGWYGVQGDAALTEASAAGRSLTHGSPTQGSSAHRSPAHKGFTHRVCAAWEREAGRIGALGPRVVTLRIGLVLAVEGGLLARFLTPFEFGLGGRIGDGRQWMSWITRDDLVRLIVHAIGEARLAGPVNATAPNPVRNAAFVRALAAALHRPALVPVPAWPLERIGGDYARELLLGGQRVLPQAALATGFRFLHPDLAPALAGLLGADARPAQAGPRVEARGLPSAP